jgi:hypothetical protein
MLHRAFHRMHEQYPLMIKWCNVKSQSMKDTTKSTVNVLLMLYPFSWNVGTILFMAIFIRSIICFSVISSLEVVNSFETNRSIRILECSFTTIARPLVMNKNNFSWKKTIQLQSTRVDILSKKVSVQENTATSSDEILKGVSKTTQLLLQTPQNEIHRQCTIESNNESNTVSKKQTKNRERTLYEILGTTPTATKEELKRQYISLAKLTHPDAIRSQQSMNGKNELFVEFTDVAAAYHILSNPIERKKYDRTLHSTQMIQMLVILGDVCIGTTLTVAEITSTIIWVALMIVLQPLAVHATGTDEIFCLSIDDGSISK